MIVINVATCLDENKREKVRWAKGHIYRSIGFLLRDTAIYLPSAIFRFQIASNLIRS